MKKILIVEDSSIIIIGIQHILNDLGFDQAQIDTADSFDKMLVMLDKHDYELVLFGLRTDQNKLLKPLLELVQKRSTTIFMVFAEILDMNILKKMYKAGVKGIIDKIATRKEISFSIQRVLENELYLNSAFAIKLLYSSVENKNINAILTEREKQVAELLAQGKKNIYIGNTLNMMPSTVSTFKTKIFNKLNIQNILELKEWRNSHSNYR